MRFKLRHTLLSTACLLGALSGHANNITTSTGSLVNNTGTTVQVQFNITWQNSWRIAPDRRDAAWVFVKYRTSDGAWGHCSLNNTGHTAPSGSTITAGLVAPASAFNASTNPAVGVFIHRSADGSGTFTANGVQLLWNYSVNGIALVDVTEIRVFAIEMVYVPQGAFFVGSGGTEVGSFTDGAWTSGATIPRQITSEGAITIGQVAGNLWGKSSTGNSTIGPSGTLPAAFPKGFAAFYCMKYEVTQQGYVDFLNTLTYNQQVSRTAEPPSSPAGTEAMDQLQASLNRNQIRIQTSGVASSTPARYETTIGDVACNFLTSGHVTAYLDWSGLRPMTELEFEKACRGTLPPVADAFPWGGTIASSAYTLTNSNLTTEGIGTNYSTTLGNANYVGTGGALTGPLRVGIFAANGSNSGRVTSGASFYGIMELGGNVSECLVTVGNAQGRAYTGTHGNGVLAATGDADASSWSALGTGSRGGSWNDFSPALRVSDRTSGISGGGGTVSGGRGGRLAL